MIVDRLDYHARHSFWLLAGWLVCLALPFVASGLSLGFSRSASGSVRGAFGATAALAWLLSAGATFALAASARRIALEETLTGLDSLYFQTPHTLHQQVLSLLGDSVSLGAPVLAASLLTVGAAVVLGWARSRRGLAVLALALGLAAALPLAAALGATPSYPGFRPIPPIHRPLERGTDPLLLAIAREGSEYVDATARSCVALAAGAALLAAVAAIVAARRRVVVGRGALAVGFVWAGLGAAAYAATRDVAVDARAELPPLPWTVLAEVEVPGERCGPELPEGDVVFAGPWGVPWESALDPRHVWLAVGARADLRLRTIPLASRRGTCFVPIEVSPRGEPLSDFRTPGDLGRALTANPSLRLDLAR